jgi:hypothetical protein
MDRRGPSVLCLSWRLASPRTDWRHAWQTLANGTLEGFNAAVDAALVLQTFILGRNRWT